MEGIKYVMQWIGNRIPDCIRNAFQNLLRCFQAAPVAEVAAEDVLVDATQTGMGALCTRLGTGLVQLYEVSPMLGTAIFSGSLGYAMYAYNADPDLSPRMAIGFGMHVISLLRYLL